jgi:dTDP-glucose 4,6-dehydratase
MPPLSAIDLEHVLAHTQAVWDELRGARLLVTGGTGFFGSWLVESFVHACHSLGLDATLTVLTRSPEAFRDKAPHLAHHRAIRLLRGDVRMFSDPGARFTHCIHGATEANATLNREQPLRMLDTIVDGTRRTLDVAVTSGVQRFLLLSSGAVYGAQPNGLSHIPEEYSGGPDPTDPHWVYGEGKRVAELTAGIYARQHGIDCTIARCFTFAGPHLPLDAHFAIGNFIGDCLASRPVKVLGAGTAVRSYLYTADLAVWLWTILVRGQSCRAYNVGSEEAVSIVELARRVSEVMGAREPARLAEQPAPSGPAERYVPDTSRARRELGLGQTIPLDEAIRRTAQWHTVPASVFEEAHV